MSPETIHDRLGRPLRELRLSVTDRCNFRCNYCMPDLGSGKSYRFMPRSELLSFEELERLVWVLVEQLGLRKVRLTGGEPLLRSELDKLVARLAAIKALNDLPTACSWNGKPKP